MCHFGSHLVVIVFINVGMIFIAVVKAIFATIQNAFVNDFSPKFQLLWVQDILEGDKSFGGERVLCPVQIYHFLDRNSSVPR